MPEQQRNRIEPHASIGREPEPGVGDHRAGGNVLEPEAAACVAELPALAGRLGSGREKKLEERRRKMEEGRRRREQINRARLQTAA